MTAPQAEALHGINGVMQRLNISRTKAFELVGTGELKSVKLGKRRLVSESSLVAYIAELDHAAKQRQALLD
jgi:excisionase family DNA binding protein